MINRISKDDLFGRFFVKKPNGLKWNSYYQTIDALRLLFVREDFEEKIEGFYLNVTGNFDAVRISYFVGKENIEKAIYIFKQFFRNHNLIEIKQSVFPKKTLLAKDYGGPKYEVRFRNFLHLSTQIGLDLIKENLPHAKILFATYRWQVRKASSSFKKHFEPTFKKYSSTYRSLSNIEKQAFLKDLEKWPNPNNVDWAHLMVNFVLGCDWNGVFRDPNYLTPGRPLSIQEINEKVKPLGFQIPKDWKPYFT